jgi:hypothetical protein
MCLEPEPKRQKGSVILQPSASTELGTEHRQSETELAPNSTDHGVRGGGWWESDDARRLFAPCSILYGTSCDVKDIVMERIESF